MHHSIYIHKNYIAENENDEIFYNASIVNELVFLQLYLVLAELWTHLYLFCCFRWSLMTSPIGMASTHEQSHFLHSNELIGHVNIYFGVMRNSF